MEKFHFSQFNFPIQEKVVESERPKTKLKKIRRLSLNPRKSNSNAPSPTIKHQKVLPEELEKITKTSISTVEDHYQGRNHTGKVSRINKANLNDSCKVYRKIINSLERKKQNRSKNKQETKSGPRDNPWRYSLSNSCCVFDVNLLARNTFQTELLQERRLNNPQVSRLE